MTVQLTDFSRMPLQDSPWATIFEDALKGYKIGQEPSKMAQEARQKKETEQHTRLANSIQEEALKHLPEKYRQEAALNEARINKSNRGPALTGALAQAQALRRNSKEGSQEWNEANDYIKKLNTPKGDSKGISFSSTPEGGFQVNVGGTEAKTALPNGRKLKAGESWALDPKSGELLGVNVPLTSKQQVEESGKLAFNTAYPFMNESLGNYSGENSWKKFSQDMLNYRTDESAKERIDNYFAAKNLLSNETTTENARIGGHSTDQQLRQLRKSLNSSEVNKHLENAAGFVLPEGYKIAAGNIFQKHLNEMSEASKKLPSFYTRYDPGKDPSEQKSNDHDLVYNPATGRLE